MLSRLRVRPEQYPFLCKKKNNVIPLERASPNSRPLQCNKKKKRASMISGKRKVHFRLDKPENLISILPKISKSLENLTHYLIYDNVIVVNFCRVV